MRSHLENRTAVSSTARAPPSEALENAPDLASPCSASYENICFKENININKSESPKLSLDPLQMKRKKKGGGYNLRKSLAWDRAFFTEEGILDPLELSTISDVTCKEGLPFIHEETPGGSQQDEDLAKHRKKDCSSTKLDSSSSNFMTSTSLTAHKCPTHLGSKPGSRYGDCPRPLPSPSLKRRANVNVGKAAGKELKLPKVPGLKPGLSPTCATSRNTILRANCVKHNQITQPDFGTQRHSVLKSSSKSLKNTQNAPSTNTLQLTHHSQENSGNSAFKRLSSINMSPLMADKADNSGSKMISDNATPVKPYNSFECQQYSTTFATPFSQNAHISGRTMHPLQKQTMKPSGLRMPSPSLSFFSQPKPLVSRDLPLRATETDVFGSEKTGNLRLQDKLRGTPKTYSRIPDSTISIHKAVSSRSECMMPPQVSAMDLIKPNSEKNIMHKIQDRPKKNIIERISHEEAELQEISIEVPSQSGFREQTTDIIFKAIHGHPEKSESCESGWRNAELGSITNHAIQEFETISAIDEPPKEKNTCNFLVLNHGSTQCTDVDDRVQNTLTMQSDKGKTCKPDCHEPHRDKIEPIKYSLADTDMRTDEDKDLLMIKERASEQLGEKRSREQLGEKISHEQLGEKRSREQLGEEREIEQVGEERASEQLGEERASMQLGVLQQNGSCCSGIIKAVEQRQTKTQNPYFGSKHLCVDLVKESASIEVLADNLSSGEALMDNSVCDSTTGDCNNDINLLPEVGDDTKQPQKGSEVQTICLKVEMGLEKIVNSNSSDRLSHEKQRSHQNSQQEENVEKLMFAALDRKDGDEVIDTRMSLSPSPDRWHCINLCRQNIAQPLVGLEFDFTDNSLSSESRNSLINTIHSSNDEHEGNDTVLLNATTIQNLSNCLHQDTQRMESDDCNSLSESRILQLSQKCTLKMTKESPSIQDDYANNRLISTMSVEDNESDSGNLRGLWNTETILVQSPESNILNNCCLEQSERLTLARDAFVAENLVHSDHTLRSKSYKADMYCEDNTLGSMEDSVTGQNEICLTILKSSRLSEKESPLPLKREGCNDAYETGACFVDATSPSIVEPISDSIKDEISEHTNSSFSCVHPKLAHVKVEVAEDPINKHGDSPNEKSLSLVLPQNAIPFSDEWLAAIEAAGEDILTKKSGAVQNSPPDKSLPEPSPWSPVKRKNNQIGPFDCTKKFTTVPSDSN